MTFCVFDNIVDGGQIHEWYLNSWSVDICYLDRYNLQRYPNVTIAY